MQTSYQTTANTTTAFTKLSSFSQSLVMILAILGGGASVQAAVSDLPEISLTTEQLHALAIKTQTVKTVESYPSSQYVAQSIVPINQRYALTMPVDGQITELLHFHGNIQKDDVIAVIYSAELLKLQSDFISTLADLKAEKASLIRAKKLIQTGAVSNKQRQQLEASVKKLNQSKSQQKLELLSVGMDAKLVEQLEKTQKLQSAELELKAPVSGELFDAQIQLGQRLMAQESVIYIAKIDPIVIDVEVPVEQSKQIFDGQAVSLVNSKQTGLVAHVADFVDSMTQSVEVHTRFDNPDFVIKPGQTFKMQFNFDKPAYQTQLGALSMIENASVIFVQTESGIKAIEVEVLQTQNAQLYFNPVNPTAINEKSLIVVHGASSLKNSLMAEEGEE